MAHVRKRNRLKEWLSNFLSPVDEIRYMPDGPQRHALQRSFINNAQGFTLHNPTMTAVQGDQYTMTYVQGLDNRNLVPLIMKLLSDHIIIGAAHDDSARVPPPRCHPGTRINLITRITAWFNGEAGHELLLWITGPAGVGKSAVVQTFAEYLVGAKLLGASIFCSRPNKRNNPYRIFITIAYQLAVRIVEYREFIVERLSLDPQLLNRDMATQFKTFIIEPFVEKKIGAGGRRWGILLDGLDELEGEDAQCDIIRLISTFAHEYRDAPLVWIIASRPEPHISNTFNDEGNSLSHWSEYIPIDSTEACNDVERFLRSSFETTRRKFRQSVPTDWPSNSEFLKLAAAASGLFVYAEVVMEFIRDSESADPALQLETVLLAIDRSNTAPTKDNPFVQLDVLYKEILSSIPPKLWPTTKRLLGFLICREKFPIDVPKQLGTVKGTSALFGLTRHVIYACLIRCHSTVRVPDWKVAHKEQLTILHASFADYLMDSNRSGNFHVSNEDAKHDMLISLLEIWEKCSVNDIAAATVESAWHRYCSKLDDKAPSQAIAKFHAELFFDVAFCLGRWMHVILKPSAEYPLLYAKLRKFHMTKLCYYFDAYHLWDFVDTLLDHTSAVHDIELLREVQLKDIKFGHLDRKEMSPTSVHFGRRSKFSKASDWILHRPRSNSEFKAFVMDLETIQKCSPEVKVIIFGGICEGRVAAFRHSLYYEPRYLDFVTYIIPYPE